jgi:hypothetical protein
MGHPVRAILTIFNFCSGVDLFLAISGFVIAELNYRSSRRRAAAVVCGSPTGSVAGIMARISVTPRAKRLEGPRCNPPHGLGPVETRA